MTSRQSLSGTRGDINEAEALKHTIVAGETVAGNAATSWIYPGDAVSIALSATDSAKVQMRGGGGAGLEVAEVRNLQPTIGVNNPQDTNCGVVRLQIVPHEFRMLDTSGSENKITWTLFY